MARQNNRNQENERKNEAGQKRDAASNAIRFSIDRAPRYSNERERDVRHINMSRYYLNDLYERSSI
ncbi:MAG TPA: hypothetical protein VNR87_05445 [Flavisolibacter sp.]|nr:hypothetical protein [Flavisolibacter sp.]